MAHLQKIVCLTETLKLRQQVRAGANSGGVLSRCILSSRDSAAGSAHALMDVMDILNLYFSTQALGGKVQGCEAGFAFVICIMPVMSE